jgi:hypothetical protein
MTQHVYTRVAGFRLTVIPRAPFRIQRDDAALNAIDVEYQAPGGPLFARLVPKDGGYTSKIDQSTRSLYDVLDIENGPDLDDWRLETSVFTCAWPHGYAVCSNNFPNDPGPFDLIGPNNEMIYIQTPRQLPALKEMRAPNQKVKHIEHRGESGWIELEYTNDGEPWCQRHEIAALSNRRMVVTMQAPIRFSEPAAIAAVEIVKSLVFPANAR